MPDITRRLTTILAADVAGYSRLAGADEEGTVSRLRALRQELIDPVIAANNGRTVKTTGDGRITEFASVVDAVRAALEVQRGMAARNANIPPDRRIDFRVGIHLGDIIVESDGDLMGDGVNIAARLEGICEPGAICLSEDAYRQVRDKIAADFTDLGERELKNIARPVRAYALSVGKTAQAQPATPPRKAPLPTSPRVRGEEKQRGALRGGGLFIAGIAALIVIAAGAWYFLAGQKQGSVVANAPAHLSIVVLPFQNLSGDPKQDYFADGITDNLTTDLSRIRNSFVIARNTAFTYKGKAVDAKEIGKELGVRYVLEGSVARDGNRVRVNAQFIDAESGSHLWADRFEDDLADLFKLQDDVVARLANALGYELVKAEAAKGTRAGKPDAIDLAMRGRALLWREPPTKENNGAARGLFEKALRIDPNDADALAGEAWTYQNEYTFGWTSPGTDYDAKILGLADKAIAIAPETLLAYRVKASYLFTSHRGNEALGVVDAELAIDPNSVGLYPDRGVIENILGRPEAAKSDLQQAMRLSPRDPNIGFWHVMLGDVEFHSSRFDAAIDEYRKAIDGGFHTFIPYGNMAAAYALEGKMDEAKPALAEARRLNPNLTVKWLMAHAPNVPILFEGYRKAGLPEDDAAPAKHLSIVVLPFDNLSGDPKQDYFADGITDNLTTDLSRIRNSFVIARNTAFTYKGKAVDAKEISKELGVRYVLEGSVARDGNRVRVNAQLIDAESGAHLWADRFEEELADLFKLQDDVVARLANTLGYELVKAEAAKSAHSANPDSLDLYFQGMALLYRGLTPKDSAKAQDFFRRALALDPDNIDAMLGTASIDTRLAATYVVDDRTARLASAEAVLTKVLSLAPDNAKAHELLGSVEIASNRAAEAIAELQRALTLNPNLASAHAGIGFAKYNLGHAEETETYIQEALRLSPRDTDAYSWMLVAGVAKVFIGADAEAVAWMQRCIESNPNLGTSHFVLAAALANLGRLDEARAVAKSGLALDPKFTIHRYVANPSSDNPAYLVQRERLIGGWRKAGLPEDDAAPAKHLSIVVLPFDNLSGDPKQDYFADGITDNLTTDLSRIRNSFVIARNTAFTYRGKAVDAKAIGKELGVHYVLEGSVARDGNRVRVNAQLIDAESGAHLWADRFEEEMANLFDLQDEIVGRLANVLDIELVNAESERGGSRNPDAIDLGLRGWALNWRPPTKELVIQARALFEEALKIDPNDDNALSGIAYTYLREFFYGWGEPSTDYLAKLIDPADHAITINPHDAMAYYSKSFYLSHTHREAEALAVSEAGLANNPSAAALYMSRAIAEIPLGRYERARSDLKQAMRLNPLDTQLAPNRDLLANVELQLGDDMAAIEDAREALEEGYRVWAAYAWLAAAEALSGKSDDATRALNEARRINPSLTIKWAMVHSIMTPRLVEGLRKAGLPEQ